MNLIPNATSTALGSAAVWAAAIVGVITFTINAMVAPSAPDWVAHFHPAEVKQTWDWLLPIVTTAAVAIGRVINQTPPTAPSS